MAVRFANSYVERLFAERDMLGLYHLISVVSAERQLPEEFWLFSRLLEWVDAHEQQIESAAFELIAARKDDSNHETYNALDPTAVSISVLMFTGFITFFSFLGRAVPAVGQLGR